MKTPTRETTCKCSANQQRTGFFQTGNLRKILHINHTVQPAPNFTVQTYQTEHDRRVQELESELRRDTARAYAEITPFR